MKLLTTADGELVTSTCPATIQTGRGGRTLELTIDQPFRLAGTLACGQ